MQDKDIRTFADFAEWKKTEHDNMFAVNVLKQLFTAICNTDNEETLFQIFAQPESTRDDDWDRLIEGVALYASHIKNIPLQWVDWARKPLSPQKLFIPVSHPAFFPADYAKTPIELRMKAVCLPKGSLYGV